MSVRELLHHAREEDHVLRESDIEVIYVNGYGFPAWRGGPIFYADCVGLVKVVERMTDFEREFGSQWKVAPLLPRLAESGMSFRELDRECKV